MEQERESLFRKEALDYHAGGQEHGDVLRLSPAWTRWAFGLLLAAVVFYSAFGVLGRISEYASGPAIVQVEGRMDLAALAPGVVTSVEVQPGQRVAADQVLVRFSAAQEQAELDRFNREFELQLVRRMQDLSDEGARQALSALRAQKELAESRLEQRTVKAPEAGVVSDVRIRRGQHLAAGDVVVSLVRDASPLVVTAMLPGEYRPLLSPGSTLRLELQGFPYQYQELTIDSVGDELVGPNEVRRFLGPEQADSVVVRGAVVLVRSHMPARFFEVDGARLAYFDGMLGTAHARVKSERILVTLVPGLKALFR